MSERCSHRLQPTIAQAGRLCHQGLAFKVKVKLHMKRVYFSKTSPLDDEGWGGGGYFALKIKLLLNLLPPPAGGGFETSLLQNPKRMALLSDVF